MGPNLESMGSFPVTSDQASGLASDPRNSSIETNKIIQGSPVSNRMSMGSGYLHCEAIPHTHVSRKQII